MQFLGSRISFTHKCHPNMPICTYACSVAISQEEPKILSVYIPEMGWTYRGAMMHSNRVWELVGGDGSSLSAIGEVCHGSELVGTWDDFAPGENGDVTIYVKQGLDRR